MALRLEYAAVPAAATPYDNMTPGDIADALGHVRAELAALREREEGLKTELLERGVARADGRLFRAVVSKAVSWRLDTARLKTEFGEDWVTARSKPVSSTSVRVSAHEEAQIRRTP